MCVGRPSMLKAIVTFRRHVHVSVPREGRRTHEEQALLFDEGLQGWGDAGVDLGHVQLLSVCADVARRRGGVHPAPTRRWSRTCGRIRAGRSSRSRRRTSPPARIVEGATIKKGTCSRSDERGAIAGPHRCSGRCRTRCVHAHQANTARVSKRGALSDSFGHSRRTERV
jgi:hypothetical protein